MSRPKTPLARSLTRARALVAGASALAIAAGLGGALVLDTHPVRAEAVTGSASVAAPGFADLVAQVKPAVVSVRVKSRGGVATTSGENPFGDQNPFEGTPFEKFFKKFGQPDGRNGTPKGEGPLVMAQGSGFFVSADGYVVTNNHVVDGAVKVELVADNGDTYDARVIGTDPKTDLALLKVDGHTDFPYVELATSKPRIGEWVLAMGNPFGLGGTVTAGIVSAEGRDIGSGPYDDFIQIDAPVNRGNSGGPTFNLEGKVIGVNTAIFSPSGGSVGIAFDIPASTVASVITQLKEHGRVERAWLGVQIQPVTKEIASSLDLPEAKGALIAEAQGGGPGAKAGLKSGDVIVRVDDHAVVDARDLARTIGGYAPNSTVVLGIYRDGQSESVKVALGRMEDQSTAKGTGSSEQQGSDQMTLSGLGLSVAPAASVDGAGNEGLMVTGVDGAGAAADAGLSTGDVLLKAGGRRLSAGSDLEQALADAKSAGKKSTLVLVRRGNDQLYVALPANQG
ncbi:MAG: Do family serine endopeptidase [Hyphomicrobiaceae bacterium]